MSSHVSRFSEASAAPSTTRPILPVVVNLDGEASDAPYMIPCAVPLRRLSIALYAAVVCGAAWLLILLLVTLNIPMFDAFGFRQTQTAINVYWMLHEHVFVNYLTPVLGAPWSLPFEAPVYQVIVAGLQVVSGLSIDASGRIISVMFFVCTLTCCYQIIRQLLPTDRTTALLFVAAALMSPHVVFWARTFMIESCAMFFGAAWLLCAIRGTQRPSRPLLLLSIPFCVLCALTKVTTWPAFVVAYALFMCWQMWRSGRIPFSAILLAGTGIVLALVLTLVWTWHADRVKQLNLLGDYLTSANLQGWNYGTWSQFFSRSLWGIVVPQRILPQILGYGWPVLLLTIRYVRMDSAYTILAIVCSALFLVPIALFTNLHLVHDYYQTANALFLIAAVVLLIAEMIAVRKILYASVVGIALFSGAVIHIRDNEWPIATGRHDLNPGYIAAQMVRDSTPPNSSLIVFGVDWSSEINYYAERKGLALPGWAALQKAGAILNNPNAYMGGLEVGAVIDCRSVFQKYGPELDKLIDTFVKAWAQKSTLVSGSAKPGSCLVYLKAT
jgi:hypothetical protein